ncbi:MAG: HAMP domain-containing histidine kinase, partial [Verrucomicrobia bacterium]|nr:HAMP domain-containing histidine kinase [Verrucomicrobiota bacterium]
LFGYILEGAMLLINCVREGGEGFRLTLLAGWTVSFIVWLVRCANNLGLYSYPVSLGSYVAMGYTISFLFCINARFAGKYQQAEELLTEKTLLSQNLERQVTERTADLEEALTAVKKSEKTRRQFTMNIIHNLKTPLFSIQGYTELLSEEMKEADETAREYLSCVSGNVEYVQKLISQLLLIDRIEEKRITYQFHPISLSGFLDRLIATESAVLQDKKLQLETDNLLPADFMFEGDAFYLAQALLNILDNAIRHSPEGGKVRVTAQMNEGNFAISIRDYGEGMTESVRNHIFERGYSYHTDGGKSSGLGLNIALGIVREHGGDIRVQSEPGKGSCFEVILPQKQEEEHGMLS